MPDLPPASEIFNLTDLSARHPKLLPENRLRWAARNRKFNGLEKARAVYESPTGELLFWEPAVLAWLLGLSGRSKPRAARKPNEEKRAA
jgi:hypothetical protein